MAMPAPIRAFGLLRAHAQLCHRLSPRISVSGQTSLFHTSRPSFLVIGEKSVRSYIPRLTSQTSSHYSHREEPQGQSRPSKGNWNQKGSHNV
jgi:hypothetical protein